MPAQTQTTVKALGLNINPNFLDLPNGTLVEANDVIIRRQDVIESRRGLSDWSAELGPFTDRASQLSEYKNRILAFHNGTLSYDTGLLDTLGKAIFDDFAGTYHSPGDYRIRSIEANKNFYFTSDNGIKKISSVSASDFTTAPNYITDAGAIKAIDYTATLNITQGQIDGFLPVDSGVAYRHLWAKRDANNNFIAGSPSNRAVVYNTINNSVVMDFNRLVYILDLIGSSATSLINLTTYSSLYALGLNALGVDIRANLIAVAGGLDTDILLATDSTGAGPLKLSNTVGIAMDAAGVVTLTFSTGNPSLYIQNGDVINITGLTTSSPNLTVFNGPQTVVGNPTATTLSFVYKAPTGGTLTSFAARAWDVAGVIHSYNYTNIINTGDDNFPSALNDTPASTPATSGQMATISNTIQRIITRLSLELPAVLPAILITEYISDYTITTSGNTTLVIDIPTDSQGNQLTSDYFLQLYRSNVFKAFNGSQFDSIVLGESGAIPDDELHLIFEYFPSATDFSNKYITYADSYPDSLAQSNTPLYTNPVTGDGILQSNDIPPFAQDINLFKNVTFFANTQSNQIINSFTLLGVDNITNGDKLTIASDSHSSTYTFIDGTNEKVTFTLTATTPASVKTALQNKYFFINSADDVNKYYVWYRYDGVGTDPLVAGRTGIIVDLITGDTVALACQRTSETLSGIVYDFTSTYGATTFVVTNINAGYTTSPTIGNISSGNLAVAINTSGTGELASTGQVLISRTLSAAVNIQLTAESLVRVINKSSTSPVYAYYTSGDNTTPGQMTLMSKLFSDGVFYIIASGPRFQSGNTGLGTSFTPDISPMRIDGTTIVTSGVSGYITFTTTSAHGLQNGDKVLITNSNATGTTGPFTNVDGVYTVANATTYTFDALHAPIDTSAGTHFSWENVVDSVSSTNTVKPNRLYYSKFNQPDAVPLLNYFDIGREDKAILRIFPLRSSLFIFKEDGLYRVSGEVAPFTVQLFDSSCILIAPDTVDVTENVIYGWTLKGISSITESGVSEISKPVDINLFRIATFPAFKTATWGTGYNSDSSYVVFTTNLDTDTSATIGYRFSTLTNTWTNIVRSQTCGIVKAENDLLYMGNGIENNINQERKHFDRTDYADKDFTLNIQVNAINTTLNTIQFSGVSGIDVGDVVLQDQYLTVYAYNNTLKQLDLEPSLAGVDFYNNLNITTGANLRDAIVALANLLDIHFPSSQYYNHISDFAASIISNDTGSPTVLHTSTPTHLFDGRILTLTGSNGSIPALAGTYEISVLGSWASSTTFTIPLAVTTSGTTGVFASTTSNLQNFADIKACWNAMMTLLNSESTTLYHHYSMITVDSPMEAVVIAVDRSFNKITLNQPEQWVQGDIQIYKAIPCEIIYSPLTFGDAMQWKQLFQATAMFSNTDFTDATLSFSSDLKPDYVSVHFYNDGVGTFGTGNGFGTGYFGGAGNAKPFRTLIPLQKSRCRFLNVKWAHQVAREVCECYGITLTGNLQTGMRAYR